MIEVTVEVVIVAKESEIQEWAFGEKSLANFIEYPLIAVVFLSPTSSDTISMIKEF